MCDLSICPRSLATFPRGSLSRLAGVGCAGPFFGGPLASRSAGSLSGPRSEGLRGWLSISGRGHLGRAAPLSAYYRCGWRHVLIVSTASALSFRRFGVCGGPAHLASAWREDHVCWTVSERTGILFCWCRTSRESARTIVSGFSLVSALGLVAWFLKIGEVCWSGSFG